VAAEEPQQRERAPELGPALRRVPVRGLEPERAEEWVPEPARELRQALRGWEQVPARALLAGVVRVETPRPKIAPKRWTRRARRRA
jgi:hypothetical protein